MSLKTSPYCSKSRCRKPAIKRPNGYEAYCRKHKRDYQREYMRAYRRRQK